MEQDLATPSNSSKNSLKGVTINEGQYSVDFCVPFPDFFLCSVFNVFFADHSWRLVLIVMDYDAQFTPGQHKQTIPSQSDLSSLPFKVSGLESKEK